MLFQNLIKKNEPGSAGSLQKFPTNMIKASKVKSEEDLEYEDEDSLRRFTIKPKIKSETGEYQLIYHHSSSPSLNSLAKKPKVSIKDSSLSNCRINESKIQIY
jgi:hypothetical protein